MNLMGFVGLSFEILILELNMEAVQTKKDVVIVLFNIPIERGLQTESVFRCSDSSILVLRKPAPQHQYTAPTAFFYQRYCHHWRDYILEE